MPLRDFKTSTDLELFPLEDYQKGEEDKKERRYNRLRRKGRRVRKRECLYSLYERGY